MSRYITWIYTISLLKSTLNIILNIHSVLRKSKKYIAIATNTESTMIKFRQNDKNIANTISADRKFTKMYQSEQNITKTTSADIAIPKNRPNDGKKQRLQVQRECKNCGKKKIWYNFWWWKT